MRLAPSLLLFLVLLVLVAGCSPQPAPSGACVDVPAATEPAPESDARDPGDAGAKCALVAAFAVAFPAGTRGDMMVDPERGPREEELSEESLAGKSGRERIVAAVNSAIRSESESKIDVTPLPDGTYRVRVRARTGEAAACHGRYDALDLRGAAKLVDDSVAIDLSGTDRVTEDICSVSGRGRNIVGRHDATASLRIARRC